MLAVLRLNIGQSGEGDINSDEVLEPVPRIRPMCPDDFEGAYSDLSS